MNKIDLIELRHLSGNQREIADVIGIEAYRKLVRYFGGERIAVAKPSSLITATVRKDIILEHISESEVMRCMDVSSKEIDRIKNGLK